MQATFYNNKSDKRYLNKTIEAKYSNIPIEVLEPSSIIRPSLRVSSGLVGQSVNYIYVNELERYYYIKDWIMENGHIRLECEVDVLMSFKDAIKQQNVILSRQEKNYNLYQVDNKMKLLNAPATRVIEFPSGFDYSTQEFVLILTGSAS